jgi:hypothetical protein
MWAAALIILAGSIRSLTSLDPEIASAFNPAPPPVTHPNFKPLVRCWPFQSWDYSNDRRKRITIAMGEGCYGDHITLPTSWSTFTVSKTQNPGDYASIWCDGQQPGPIVENDTDGMRGTMPQNCIDPKDPTEHSANFRLQGHGTMVFEMVTSR